jgi:NAD(P)-dependent dehydrogenase (short-subunit alcohol dehydrogenase family)
MKRTVVVTGCSSGFGHQVSAALARRGDRVYATMRGVAGKNEGIARDLRTLAAGEKLDLRVLEIDVTSNISVDAAAAKVLAESGAPDAVINNAGQMFVGIAEAFNADEFTKQLDVNVVGIHRVTRAFLPAMRKRGQGLFINLSSVAGRVAVPFNSLYHASKWAVEGYSLALRRELASSGIDVVVVEPGPFTTSLFPSMRQPEDAEGRASTYPAAAHQVFKQMGSAFEVMLKDPAQPTAPALVVDRMIELVGMKPGTRPFRSVVGNDFGARGLNASAEPHEDALMESMGLTGFARIAPTRTA